MLIPHHSSDVTLFMAFIYLLFKVSRPGMSN